MTSSVTQNLYFKDLALVGGHRALDLLNSVKYRGRIDPMDAFGSFNDVVDWAKLIQIIDTHEAEILRILAGNNSDLSNVIFRDICAFRENLRCVLEPGITNSHPQKIAAAALENDFMALRPSAQIDIAGRTLTRSYPICELVDLKHRLVHMAVELMEILPAPHIGCCAADDCDWLFVDRSKAKRRRWCDTRTCGNRARVRQFRKLN